MSALLAVALLIALLALANPSPSNRAVFVDPNRSLESINAKNNSAKSVFCPNIRTGIASKSSFFYNKPNKITFLTDFLGTREATVFQDDSIYWFWIRSFDKDSVYFCSPDKIDSAGLRAIMRPEVMSAMSWIEEIRPESVREKNGIFTAVCDEGQSVKIVEFDEEKVLSQSIFFNGTPIATLRGHSFKEFSGILFPMRITATWHEEGLSGYFSVDEWIVNKKGPEISEPFGLKRIELVR